MAQRASVLVPAAADSPDARMGTGLYSLAELSRYLRGRSLPASSPKVLRWIRAGLAASDHQGLLVVGWLRSNGVQLAAIRKAEAYLREERRIARPFATQEIFTDGINVLYRANPSIADQLTAANRRGQEVLLRTLGDTLWGVAYDSGLAVWWDIREHVRLDPAVQFGAPCLAGTRIPTAQLFALQDAGDTREQIAALFAQPRELVDEAIEFEAELARAA